MAPAPNLGLTWILFTLPLDDLTDGLSQFFDSPRLLPFRLGRPVAGHHFVNKHVLALDAKSLAGDT